MEDSLVLLVKVVHVIWVILWTGGIFLALRYKKWIPVQLAIIGATFFSWFFFGGCPLWMLEKSLTGKEIAYQGNSFIATYLDKWLGVKITVVEVEISAYIIAALFVCYLLSLVGFKIYMNLYKSKDAVEKVAV